MLTRTNPTTMRFAFPWDLILWASGSCAVVLGVLVRHLSASMASVQIGASYLCLISALAVTLLPPRRRSRTPLPIRIGFLAVSGYLVGIVIALDVVLDFD